MFRSVCKEINIYIGEFPLFEYSCPSEMIFDFFGNPGNGKYSWSIWFGYYYLILVYPFVSPHLN